MSTKGPSKAWAAFVVLVAAGIIGYSAFFYKNRGGPAAAREPSVEIVKGGETDWYGNVYYYDKTGRSSLIAPSKTVENGMAKETFDSILYTEARLSPNGRWIALEAACWEEDCLQVYDLNTRKLYAANVAAQDTQWLSDGRIRVVGLCSYPTELCGTYESSSPDTPWQLREMPEYTFETARKKDLEFGGYREFEVVIRKNDELVGAVPVENTNGDITLYTLSPDKKHVAFKTSLVEGGCVSADTLRVIDLTNLALAPVTKVAAETNGASKTHVIENIRWIDADTLEADAHYGIKDSDACGPYEAHVEKYGLQ